MADARLLFVAGASPQIITETVYALALAGLTGGDVVVLTTTRGREAILQQLLRRGGAWQRLRREYAKAQAFRFAKHDVIVLEDARGAALADVRSKEDNAAIADQIVHCVAEHTRDGSPPLYASIAGGRKTMGYLLAAAMMLYGRRDDRLSHVLVHPPELEGTDFYFPPRRRAGALTHQRPNGSTVHVAAHEVGVELADLPFLRLRAVRNPEMMRQLPFTKLVEQCQADLDVLAEPRLQILPDRSALVCCEREVELPPLRFAIYELLAERRRDGCRCAGCAGCVRCFVPSSEIGTAFRDQLRARLQGRQSIGAGAKWNEAGFRAERAKINSALRKTLRAASERYEIQVVGGRGARLYGLALVPAQITLSSSRVSNVGSNVAVP